MDGLQTEDIVVIGMGPSLWLFCFFHLPNECGSFETDQGKHQICVTK